jgi:hypothetical protein
MWDMALFRGDSVVDLGAGFQSELRPKNGGIAGRVTNRTPFDLEDAVLLTGSAGPVPWGTFRRGETRAINSPWNPTGGGSLLPPAVLQSVRGTLALSRMRRALIESLTTWSPNSYGAGTWAPPDHPVLLGWVNQPLIPAHVDGHPVHNQAAYLFLIHLPVKPQ